MKRKKALIVEFLAYHDEVLPSWVRAFHDLDYEVHVLTRKENWAKDAFAWTRRPDRTLVFQPWQRFLLKQGLPNLFFRGYDAVVFNSVEPTVLLDVARRFHRRASAVIHNANLLSSRPEFATAVRRGLPFWALAEFIAQGYLGGPDRTLFPYYLSDKAVRPAPGPLRFCVQGNFEYGRRNYPSLLEVLKRFKAEGRNDFEVVFVGNVSPRDFDLFQRAGAEYGVLDKLRFLKGGLKYQDYYSHIASCHYLLALVEPGVPDLQAYYRYSASSSISMAVGLSVIPVMDRSLAELYGLQKIALTYSPAETLYAAMSEALQLSDDDRKRRIDSLAKFRDARLAQNAANLKSFLDSD